MSDPTTIHPAPRQFLVLTHADGTCGCCDGRGEHACGSECTSCDGGGTKPDMPICNANHGPDCNCVDIRPIAASSDMATMLADSFADGQQLLAAIADMPGTWPSIPAGCGDPNCFAPGPHEHRRTIA